MFEFLGVSGLARIARQSVMRGGVERIQLRCGAKLLSCLLVAPRRLIGVCELEAQRGRLGIEPHRLFEVRGCQLEFRESGVPQSAQVVGRDRIGLDRSRPLEGLGEGCDVERHEVAARQISQRRRRVRRVRQGLFEGLDRQHGVLILEMGLAAVHRRNELGGVFDRRFRTAVQ